MAFLRKTGDKRASDDELSDDESSPARCDKCDKRDKCDTLSPTPLRQEYEIISIELL